MQLALFAGIVVAVLVTVFVWQRSTLRSALPTEAGDDAVLRQLEAQGADLTKPTHVLFYIYVPTREAAERMAREGADAVLSAEIRPSAAGDGTWLCLLQGTMVPERDRIGRYRATFERLAEREGGEYDGWEAAVVR